MIKLLATIKPLSIACFIIGGVGVWTIFHGYPPYGCVLYIVGTVMGVVFNRGQKDEEPAAAADLLGDPVS